MKKQNKKSFEIRSCFFLQNLCVYFCRIQQETVFSGDHGKTGGCHSQISGGCDFLKKNQGVVTS